MHRDSYRLPIRYRLSPRIPPLPPLVIPSAATFSVVPTGADWQESRRQACTHFTSVHIFPDTRIAKAPYYEKLNSVASVRERTIPAERSPLIGEVSANFCTQRVSRGQRDGSFRPYSRFSRQEPLLFLSSSSSVVLTRLSGPLPDILLLGKIW
jgi:hypothetical protein